MVAGTRRAAERFQHRLAAGTFRGRMDLEFYGEISFWKGPAPWYFVTLPDAESRAIEAVSRVVSYGWGVIPVWAQIGATRWPTSLFPKDGRYLVPVRVDVRRAERLALGDAVTVRLSIDI